MAFAKEVPEDPSEAEELGVEEIEAAALMAEEAANKAKV